MGSNQLLGVGVLGFVVLVLLVWAICWRFERRHRKQVTALAQPLKGVALSEGGVTVPYQEPPEVK